MAVAPSETYQYVLIAVSRAIVQKQTPWVQITDVIQHIRDLEQKYPLYEIPVSDLPLEQSPILEDFLRLQFEGLIILDLSNSRVTVMNLGVLFFCSLALSEP